MKNLYKKLDVFCYKCGTVWEMIDGFYGEIPTLSQKPICSCGVGGYSGKPVQGYIKNLPSEWDCIKHLQK